MSRFRVTVLSAAIAVVGLSSGGPRSLLHACSSPPPKPPTVEISPIDPADNFSLHTWRLRVVDWSSSFGSQLGVPCACGLHKAGPILAVESAVMIDGSTGLKIDAWDFEPNAVTSDDFSKLGGGDFQGFLAVSNDVVDSGIPLDLEFVVTVAPLTTYDDLAAALEAVGFAVGTDKADAGGGLTGEHLGLEPVEEIQPGGERVLLAGCYKWDAFCDGIQVDSVGGGNVSAQWYKYDCANNLSMTGGADGVVAPNLCSGGSGNAMVFCDAVDCAALGGGWTFTIDTLDGTLDMNQGYPPTACWVDELAYTYTPGICTGIRRGGPESSTRSLFSLLRERSLGEPHRLPEAPAVPAWSDLIVPVSDRRADLPETGRSPVGDCDGTAFSIGPGELFPASCILDAVAPTDKDVITMTVTADTPLTIEITDECKLGDKICVARGGKSACRISPTSIVIDVPNLPAGTYEFFVGYQDLLGGAPARYELRVRAF